MSINRQLIQSSKPGFKRRCYRASFAVLLISFVLSGRAYALGPLDGEVGIAWWNNEFSASLSDGEFDAGALAGHAEVWVANKWGLRGALYESDLEDVGLNSSDHFSVDVKRRLISATDNTFFAIGFGWEDIGIEDGSDTDGPRFSLEGRVGVLGTVSLYGFTAWLPELDDIDNRSDLTAQEIEAGVVFDPFPFFSVRAGYRLFKLDFDDEAGSGERAETKGFLLGAGFHW